MFDQILYYCFGLLVEIIMFDQLLNLLFGQLVLVEMAIFKMRLEFFSFYPLCEAIIFEIEMFANIFSNQ